MPNNDLQQWEIDFRKQVFKELDDLHIELIEENIPRIVEAFSYRIRKERNKDIPEKQPGWCPCYTGQPCHPQVPDLNCLLCTCPNYDSSTINGKCRAGSKQGQYIPDSNRPPKNTIWDCSGCTRYHSPGEVTLWLTRNLDKLVAEKSRLERLTQQPTTEAKE